jgi:predicted alternative tryptophan synthase beta-subunit
MDNSSFDIVIKDNFLKEEDFKKIYNIISNLPFSPNDYLGKNTSDNLAWFSHKAPDEFLEIIKKQVFNQFNKKIKKFILANYTLVSNPKPLVHNDENEKTTTNWQLLLYIKGNSNITNGTGFYIEKENGVFELNTHIGFKENRAIFFKAGNWHSPLQWSGEYSKRYSFIGFLEI